MTHENIGTARFHFRQGLLAAQVALLVLAILWIGKFTWSLVAYYQDANQLCIGSLIECHDRQQPTQQDLDSLKGEGISLNQFALVQIAFRVIDSFFFCLVGLLIFLRKRTEPATFITAFFLLSFGTIGGFSGYLDSKYFQFVWLFHILAYPAYLSLPLFFFSFPSGKVAPRGLWLVILIWGLYFFVDFILPGVDKSSSWYSFFQGITWISMFVSGAFSQIYRYFRISTPVERVQTKWVVTGVAVLITIILVISIIPGTAPYLNHAQPYSRAQMLFDASTGLLDAFIPFTVGLAIFRYRLWDIDVIIRRTLQYTILTGLLGLVYFGGVTVLQRLFFLITGAKSAAAVVFSTLFLVVLFNPVRRRVQDFIDRRFYRRKYDAEKALAEFASTARTGAELELLSSQVVRVANDSLQPEFAQIWYMKRKELHPNE